jgi:hypothetical protein
MPRARPGGGDGEVAGTAGGGGIGIMIEGEGFETRTDSGSNFGDVAFRQGVNTKPETFSNSVVKGRGIGSLGCKTISGMPAGLGNSKAYNIF